MKQPLTHHQNLLAIGQYKQATRDYLEAITAIDKQVYESIKTTLSNPASYQQRKPPKQLEVDIQKIIDLVNLTDNLPVFRISSLSDFVDESKTNLYPFHHLTHEAREHLSILCQIVNGIHQATDTFINTTLFELLEGWNAPPIVGRTNRQTQKKESIK